MHSFIDPQPFWSADLNPTFDSPLDCAALLTILPSMGTRLVVYYDCIEVSALYPRN